MNQSRQHASIPTMTPNWPQASDGLRSRYPQVARISFDEFQRREPREIYRRGTPLIIQTPIASPVDTLVKKLREQLSDVAVALFERPANGGVSKRSKVSQIRLDEFFDQNVYNAKDAAQIFRIVGNVKNYPDQIAHLLGFDVRRFFNFESWLNSANIWVSYAGQFTRAHFDELENFNIQLAGAKRFLLFPPGVRNYYVRSPLSGFGHHSNFADLEKASITTHPRLRAPIAECQEAILTNGDMLYLPFAWWHQVYSLDPINVNLNFWLATPKILRNPYVLIDSIYKVLFRRLSGLYDYQASKRLPSPPNPL